MKLLIVLAAGFLLLSNQKLLAQSLPYTNGFEAVDTSFILQKAGDTLAWRLANGGVSSSRCLLSEFVTNSSGNSAVGYFAAKRLNLTAGHTYQVAFQSKVQYSNRRKIKLAINTSAKRDSSTLIHDFGTLSASDTYQPYSTTFSVETSGQYFLIYYAENLHNHPECLWYTDDFAVTVVNSPPTCTLTGPSASLLGGYYPGVGLNLTATVTDAESNVSKVEFFVDGSKVGEDLTPSSGVYELTWVPELGGTHAITAKATDAYGATGTSGGQNISVRYRPSVTITNLTYYSTYFAGLQHVTVTATDPDGSIQYVTFYLGEDSIGTDSAAPYQMEVPLVYDENEVHRFIYAKAVDNDGLIGSAAVRIDVLEGTCSLTTPNSLLRQTMCMGDSVELRSEGEMGTTGFQWIYKSQSEANWENIASTKPKIFAHQPGYYALKWFYENNAVCTTAVDTVRIWNPVDSLAFDTKACAARLVQMKTNPVADESIYGHEVYSYQWDILPGSTSGNLPPDNLTAWENTFFSDTLFGSHSVILTVTNPSDGCVSKDTTIVILQPLSASAYQVNDGNILLNEYKAVASGGTEPYTFNWSNVDSCFTLNCYSILVQHYHTSQIVRIYDYHGCTTGLHPNPIIPPPGSNSSCLHDSLTSKIASLDSSFLVRIKYLEDSLLHLVDSVESGNFSFDRYKISPSGRVLIIPTVIHVLSHPNSQYLPAKIHRRYFINQIEYANEYLKDKGIQLCLVNEFPSNYSGPNSSWALAMDNSEFPGVLYYNSTECPTGVGFTLNPLMQAAQFSPDRYLNIFVVHSEPIYEDDEHPPCSQRGPNIGSVPGLSNVIDGSRGEQESPLTSNWEGIQMNSYSFGRVKPGHTVPDNLGYLTCDLRGLYFMHELGHYLNLYHTFEFGLDGFPNPVQPTPPDFYCNQPASFASGGTLTSISGDRVSDTPYTEPMLTSYNCENPNSAYFTNCFDEPIPSNPMSYSSQHDASEGCTSFTLGQLNRAIASLVMYRSKLISDENLYETGIVQSCGAGLNVNFEASIGLSSTNTTKITCVGSTVSIHATRTFISPTAYTFFYRLDGSGLYQQFQTGDSPDAELNLTSAGIYDVKVEITFGGNTYSGEVFSLLVAEDCTPLGRERKWHFGGYAGIEFSTGIGKPFNSPKIKTFGSTSIVHKLDGSTLLYTDGISLFDLDDHKLTSMSPLIPFTANIPRFLPRAYQGFLFVPYGAWTSNQFFNKYALVLTSDNFLEWGANYRKIRGNGLSAKLFEVSSEGEPSLNGSLSLPERNYRMGAQLAAIPHWDGENYWIVTHGMRKQNNSEIPPGSIPMEYSDELLGEEGTIEAPESKMFSYLFKRGNLYGTQCGEPISAEGSTAVGQRTTTPFPHNINTIGQIRYAKLHSGETPDSKLRRVAAFSVEGIFVYLFNNHSGELTLDETIELPSLSGCFSANGKFLYFFERISDERISLRCYDFSTHSLSSVTHDFVTAPFINPGLPAPNPAQETGFAVRGSLQLGPDGRIYISTDNFTTTDGNSGKLSVITNSNVGFPGALLVRNAIDLIPGLNFLGLPQFIDDFIIDDTPLTPEISPLSLTPDHSNNIYCSGEAIGLVKDLPESTVNHWMWDVCLLTPVDPDAVVSAEYGHFDGTDFSSAITNHGDAPIQVRFQIFVSKDEGTHYAAPEIFVVTILPKGEIQAIPFCEDGAFGIRPSHPGFSYSGSYQLYHNNTPLTESLGEDGEYFLWGDNEILTTLEGGGYSYHIQDQNTCQTSDPFQILGSAASYNFLSIPGTAFVHSNLVLNGHTQIGEYAKVFNRGQASITGTGNEEVPVVEAIKWTVEGKEAKLTVSSHALITAACDRMWQGIECTSAFDVDPPYLQVDLGADAEISHAYKALNFSDGNGNARLTADGTNFLHNYIGFEASQTDLSGSTIKGCRFEAGPSQMQYPYVSYLNHVRTGRMAINLVKGGETDGSGLAISDNTVISNYFIGINSYGFSFTMSDSRIERIRFKGLNSNISSVTLTNNHFTFEREFAPVYGWMRANEPDCCGNQNSWPGTPSVLLPEYAGLGEPPDGAIAISSRKSLTEVTGNHFETNEAAYSESIMAISGIVTADTPTIIGNTFTNLDRGVVLLKDPSFPTTFRPTNISQNTFTNNLTAVYLDNGNFNLSLKCNVFEAETPGFSVERKGVVIGEDVNLEDDRIGGLPSTTPPDKPNSNYFPRTVNATTGAIEPFPDYYSVWNESENPIKYYSYGNENLGNYHPSLISDPNYINPVPQSEITITRQNLENWCEEGTTPNFNWNLNGFSGPDECRDMTQPELAALQSGTSPIIPPSWKLACDGGPLDNIAFPIPRPAPADEETLTQLRALQENGAFLGQSIPNPAHDKVSIPLMLPVLKGIALLEVFELSTRKVLASKAIPSFGQHMIEIDIRSWASGMYGYRVVLGEGKSPSPRKMVILR